MLHRVEKDLAGEIAGCTEQVEFNPERLEYVNERLNTIYDLQQKHRVDTLDDLLRIEEEIPRKNSTPSHTATNIYKALQTAMRPDP